VYFDDKLVELGYGFCTEIEKLIGLAMEIKLTTLKVQIVHNFHFYSLFNECLVKPVHIDITYNIF